MWALRRLWHELGFDSLHVVFRQERYTAPVEQAIRLMVFNRLCDADSKLGALRWLKTVALPDVQAAETTHQHLLRTDALMDHQAAVDECVAQLLRPLIDDELSVVFYDLTTIRVEGLSEQSGELRKFGMSKEEITARQFLLGVVQTADGLPIYHLRSRATTRRREVIRGFTALWLFNSRRQAHFLLEQHKAVLLMPNVRAKPRVPMPAETAQGPGTGGARPRRLRRSCLAKSKSYAIGSWRAGADGMARGTASAKWAVGPLLVGQRDMPLALRLSEYEGTSPIR